MKTGSRQILFSLVFSVGLMILSISTLEIIPQGGFAQSAIPHNAQFISQTVPSKMIPGQPYSVSITFRNTGANTWTYTDGYRLGTHNPYGNPEGAGLWGPRRIFLEIDDNITTNERKTFFFTITAPITPGLYDFQWQMVQEYITWFGDVSPNVEVNVPSHDAKFVSQIIPITMITRQSYSVSITFRNTGANTWTYTDGYKLATLNPYGYPDGVGVWGPRRVLLDPDDNIDTGEEKTFVFNVTAPITLGVHDFQWQMVQEYETWFEEPSSNVNIRVIQPPLENATINGPQEGFVQSDYTFVANVSPISATQPITYIWQVTDQNIITNIAGLSDTVILGWDSPGTKTITITAKNGDSMVTQSHSIIIDQVSPASLDISASTEGAIETEYAFMATINPITATQPITYIWQATEQGQTSHVNGLSDSVTFSWNTTGTKTINVIAQNTAGSVSKTHTIIINAPPTDVSINGPTEGLVQTSYAFIATSSPATATLSLPISYTWQATDLGSSTNMGGTSNIISFTWPTPGVKNITVMAENPGGVVSDSYSIAIYAPPTNISVNGATTGIVEDTLNFTATVSPITVTQPITYIWQTKSHPPVEQVNGINNSASFSWNITGTQLITVSAYNLGGAISTNIMVNILPKPPTVYLPLVLKRWPPIPYPSSLYPIENADGDGLYTVNWPSTNLAQTYILEEDVTPDFTSPVIVHNNANRSWTVPAPGKTAGTYYYRVRGHNVWGYGAYSNIQSVTVLPPEAPILNAIDNADGDHSYTVSWNPAVRATSYLLEQATDATFTNPATVYEGTELSWSVTNNPSGTYYYRVKGIGPTGQSIWGKIQSVTVPPPPPPLGDGFYLVGSEIRPGKWHSTGTGTSCYWARYDSNQNIRDNHFGLSGGTVNVRQTDYEVEFHRCGTWEYVEYDEQVLLPNASEPKSDGFYTVGVEITSGRWRSTGTGTSCYWARLDSYQDILDNHFGQAGGTVTIREGDYEVEFNRCGTWVFLGP